MLFTNTDRVSRRLDDVLSAISTDDRLSPIEMLEDVDAALRMFDIMPCEIPDGDARKHFVDKVEPLCNRSLRNAQPILVNMVLVLNPLLSCEDRKYHYYVGEISQISDPTADIFHSIERFNKMIKIMDEESFKIPIGVRNEHWRMRESVFSDILRMKGAIETLRDLCTTWRRSDKEYIGGALLLGVAVGLAVGYAVFSKGTINTNNINGSGSQNAAVASGGACANAFSGSQNNSRVSSGHGAAFNISSSGDSASDSMLSSFVKWLF
jgi:hypothetical protein